MILKNDISIVLCGEAGQGVQTVETILVKLIKLSGYNVFATKEYMSRVRGGVNSTSIRISSSRVSAFTDRIDILFALTDKMTKHLKARISDTTKVISGIENNISAVGIIAQLLNMEKALVEKVIGDFFVKKGKEVADANLLAVRKGYDTGKTLDITIEITRENKVMDQIIVTGAEAIGFGAIAGGCNFISAYPMTPSTGIFTFLSQNAHIFGIVSEQAEDEISAINMALGSWFAGARAMVNTSGGGYDLMQEGLSLAGMLESPLVIDLAQRPGPATGLPTRTEQGDLELAVYSGHGEFPRIVLAPGNIEEAFYLTQKAFELTDKYQIPVFILSDQYLNDSYYNVPAFDISSLNQNRSFAPSEKGYKRYAITANGISPRCIPGFGDGLAGLDSDEHDEEGHITEDLELRKSFVEKRLKKLESFRAEEIQPELIGDKNYSLLIIGWGSNKEIIVEALSGIKKEGIAFAHFKQLHPLPKTTAELLKKAKKLMIVENNASSQFAKLIKLETSIDIGNKVLKYDGLPFSVEEIKTKIEEIMNI